MKEPGEGAATVAVSSLKQGEQTGVDSEGAVENVSVTVAASGAAHSGVGVTAGLQSLDYAVGHPSELITGENDGWLDGVGRSSYYELWNNAHGIWSYATDKIITKTIFDPCPVGYNLPRLFTFTGVLPESLSFSNIQWDAAKWTGDETQLGYLRNTLGEEGDSQGLYCYTDISAKSEVVFLPATGARRLRSPPPRDVQYFS